MASMSLVCIVDGSFVVLFCQDLEMPISDVGEVTQTAVYHVGSHSCFSLLRCKIAQDGGEKH
jgi:hypothetical protein